MSPGVAASQPVSDALVKQEIGKARGVRSVIDIIALRNYTRGVE